MVFLLWLAMLMLLVKLMLKVLSMPKLHSINGVLDKHAFTGCLPMQCMPIGAHYLDGRVSTFESLACKNLGHERDAPKQPWIKGRCRARSEHTRSVEPSWYALTKTQNLQQDARYITLAVRHVTGPTPSEALHKLRSICKASVGPTTSELRGLHPSIHATLLAHEA